MIDLRHFDWNNNKVLERNRLEARVHFYPYADEESARRGGASERVESLAGDWNFNWFSSPLEVSQNLLKQSYDPAAPSIRVPMNWQYAGYGSYCYTDLQYPFPVNPPFIPAENETGVYRRVFNLEKKKEQRILLRFEGVESGFHVFVNGQEAGYSQGSRMPSEFDITELVCEGENQLAVEVYQFCDGTYLEDQDMWWLGGITRDVLLLRRPACYLRDMILDPDYDVERGEGILRPHMPLSQADGRVELTVYDTVGEKMQTVRRNDEVRLPYVKPWTAETPVLYTVTAVVYDKNGRITEAVSQKTGFRHVEIREGVLEVNGNPIFMRGINRHEYHPKTGRAVTSEDTRRELELIKEAGLNAIRCSHYPNNPFFYDICDELGIYVIDECDLETHGFEAVGNETRLNSDPEWREAYLDRLRRMVGRDRNRACVVIWSLGNESAYGSNFRAMYEWCKENEPSRPVHYEGDSRNESVDVSGTMYSTIGRLKELDTQLEPKRPHILCEFAHAMGNGPGSLAEYFEMCEHSERIQGIFVWEFKDHGVWERREDGKELYRFGGEYGEKFHDGNFCMDGLVRSDGIPTPGFGEYMRVAEPVHVETFDLKNGFILIKNRFDFLDLSDFVCEASIFCDGEKIKTCTLEIPCIGARETGRIRLPENMLTGCPEGSLVTLQVEFSSAEPVNGQKKAGWIVGRAGTVLQQEKALPWQESEERAAECTQKGRVLFIHGRNFSFQLDPVTARIRNYKVGDVLLMENGPMLNYDRAYTDNDAPNREMWQQAHVHSMRMCVEVVDWVTEKDVLIITVAGKFAPDGRDWGTDVIITYQVWDSGIFTVSFSGDFYGKVPEELPKIGTYSLVPLSLRQVVWHGYGPGECYCDSRRAQTMGIWREEAEKMGFEYSCPQENANRTGVHWTALSDDSGIGFVVASSRPVDMAVRPFADEMLKKTAHSCDLESDKKGLHLHLDYCNSGLGSGSCGPSALAQYKAYPVHYQWKMAFAPKAAGEAEMLVARRALGKLQD